MDKQILMEYYSATKRNEALIGVQHRWTLKHDVKETKLGKINK